MLAIVILITGDPVINLRLAMLPASPPLGEVVYKNGSLAPGDYDMTVVKRLNAPGVPGLLLRKQIWKNCDIETDQCVPPWTPIEDVPPIVLSESSDDRFDVALDQALERLISNDQTVCTAIMDRSKSSGELVQWKTMCVDPSQNLLLYRSVDL